MSRETLLGYCNVHGPEQICGHTTESCPDYLSAAPEQKKIRDDFNKRTVEVGTGQALAEMEKKLEPMNDLLKEFHEIVRKTGSTGKEPKFKVNTPIEIDYDNKPITATIVRAEGTVYLVESIQNGQTVVGLAEEHELRALKN